MIRITRQTDYGIILLAYLASRPPEHILTARDAAQECRLPVPMVSKMKPKAALFSDSLSGHPKPANDGHLKTGQRE